MLGIHAALAKNRIVIADQLACRQNDALETFILHRQAASAPARKLAPLRRIEWHVEHGDVVAVGGDKLSRGLTLEGLSVSYFLRTSKMYDTLMQMGRWFGYRPGYLDLCRLFTTNTLIGWYRHIALAEAELRREFDYMVGAKLTPLDYGLRVRTHPEGMIVTALNKMCHSQKLELSWAGVLVQTTQLPKDGRIAANLAATTALLAGLGKPDAGADRETRVWRAVPAAAVAKFIEGLQYPPETGGAFYRISVSIP